MENELLLNGKKKETLLFLAACPSTTTITVAALIDNTKSCRRFSLSKYLNSLYENICTV